MADLLDNLNEKQREAVLETEGYVRVIAGAGSGKTKLLVSRYAYLVQEYGIDSFNILCVTFTNKAAGEMRRRIRALIGDVYDTSLICTYHGFCNRLLRENPEKLFLNKQFQIIDSQQQKAILGEIYQKFELKLDYASFESILKKISYAKKDGSYVTKLCDPQPCQILHEIKNQDDRIIEEFLQRQKATYSLDFHDLIAFAIHLLENDPEVREKWQGRLNYIMVDEFQDSSAVEMRLVDILSDQYRNLMIVGDPDQNIYEWRGSDVKLLVEFDKCHEPTRTIILNQNYRSTPQILKCANTLIEKNKLRLKKDLFTKNAAGAPVIHYHSRNDFEEMDQVIGNIKKLRAVQGFRYSDFAVIYRSGFLSRVVEKKLVEKNIPYEIFGGVRFYQRMEILDILAYLKLIAYDDDTCFRRIVNTPRRRFGRAKMNALEGLRESGDSFFAALSMHLDTKEFQNSGAADFVHFINSMRGSYRKKRISDIVNEVTRDSGYEEYIRELGDEERLDNLAEFKRIANEFEREFGENLSLEEFLEQIALQSGEDREDQRDTVKLMTIHASKGLEFPVVFILGFTEGVFPSAKTIGERKNLGLEEERRLCYVAITRAEKHLFLMESEGTSQNGMQKLVSRFIEEIGEQNYVRIGQISEDLKQESRSYKAKLDREIGVEQDDTRKVGEVVEHHIFGRGTIEEIDVKRSSYLIRFERFAQPRSISCRYFEHEHEDIRQKYIGQENAAASNTKCFKSADGWGVKQGLDDTNKRLKSEGGKKERRWSESVLETRLGDFAGGKQEQQADNEKEEQKDHAAGSVTVGKTVDAGLMPYDMYVDRDTETIADRTALSDSVVFDVEETEHSEESKEVYACEVCGIEETERSEENKEVNACEVCVVEETEHSEESKEVYACEVCGIEKAEGGEESKEVYACEVCGIEETERSEENKEVIACEVCVAEKTNCSETYQAVDEPDEDNACESDLLRALQRKVEQLKSDTPNLWKSDDVPHDGWTCSGIEDLGAPVGICEMCGYQIIRYAHHMEHPRYHSLTAGCVCAGRMEGDIEAAKRREADYKNRESRRASFFKKKWKHSKKGNEYLKTDGHVIVLCQLERTGNQWKYAIDNTFCKTLYPNRDTAAAAVFDALEEMRGSRENERKVDREK